MELMAAVVSVVMMKMMVPMEGRERLLGGLRGGGGGGARGGRCRGRRAGVGGGGIDGGGADGGLGCVGGGGGCCCWWWSEEKWCGGCVFDS